MRFDVITLFPELFGPHLEHGVTRRAYASGALQVRLWPLREHASDAYRRVDDRPFGGGPGMVLLAEPLERALQAVRAERGDEASVVHFTPAGRRLDQAAVRSFAQGPGAILLCGRYEGMDQRVIDRHVTHEISLGDYVLSGGEVAAMVVIDAVSRLVPGVLGDEESARQDSFSGPGRLVEGPQYTRPREFRGLAVPEVLLSGDHRRIATWRHEQAVAATRRRAAAAAHSVPASFPSVPDRPAGGAETPSRSLP